MVRLRAATPWTGIVFYSGTGKHSSPVCYRWKTQFPGLLQMENTVPRSVTDGKHSCVQSNMDTVGTEEYGVTGSQALLPHQTLWRKYRFLQGGYG